MRPDPEPDKAAIVLDCDSTIALTSAHRPVSPDHLEMQRWMVWIGLKQLVILVGSAQHANGKPVVGVSEILVRAMLHRGRVRPAL